MVVTVDDGTPTTLPHSWLQSHQDFSGTYTLRSDDGSSETDERSGTSLTAIADAVGLDPSAITYTEVFDVRGTFHPLDAGELGPATYQDGLVPLVFDSDSSGDSLTYLRPLHSSDDANNSTDPNKLGYLRTFDNSALEITFHTKGRLLHPTLDASDTTVDHDDQEVTFTAGGVTGLTNPSYAWSFAAATSVPTTSLDEWCESGVVRTSVVVTDSDGSKGRSDPLLITVALDDDNPCGPAGPPTTGPPTTGPPTTGPPTTSPPTTSPPTTSPSSSAPSTVGPTTGPTAGDMPAHPAITSSAIPTAGLTPGGDEISGTLLLAAADAVVPVSPQATSAPASASGPEAEPQDDRLTLPGWLLSGGLLVLVGGFGVLGELRPHWWRGPRPTERMRE